MSPESGEDRQRYDPHRGWRCRCVYPIEDGSIEIAGVRPVNPLRARVAIDRFACL